MTNARRKGIFIYHQGDDRCHKILTKGGGIKRVFGDLAFRDYSAEALYEPPRRYEIFHIGDEGRSLQGTRTAEDWKQLIRIRP